MILLVEDEMVLAQTLQLLFKKMGIGCIWAKTLAEARIAIASPPTQAQLDTPSGAPSARPQILVLDRNLPDGDGLTLLNESAFKSLRVLVLSSKSSIEEKVKGLERGADDYLPKPFHADELKARLAALMRRKEEVPVSGARLWAARPESLEIFTPQGWMEFTPLEFKFLNYLVAHEGIIVNKDRLLREVWGFSLLPKTRTVDYLITQLRKRIEPEPEVPVHLLTVRGAGVKFIF